MHVFYFLFACINVINRMHQILCFFFKFTQMEMLFCSTVVGLPFLIPPMLLTGELFKAWTSCYQVRITFHSFFGLRVKLWVNLSWYRFLNNCSIPMCMACWFLRPWQPLLAKYLSFLSLLSSVLLLLLWYILLTILHYNSSQKSVKFITEPKQRVEN